MSVISDDIIRELIKAGVVPDLPLMRVVIDFRYNKPVTIYYESLAEEETVDLCIENLMQNKKDLDIRKVE